MYQKNYRKQIIETSHVQTMKQVLEPVFTKEIFTCSTDKELEKLIAEYEAMKGSN